MKRITLAIALVLGLTACKPERPNVTEARAEESARRAETAKRAAEGDLGALGALQEGAPSSDATRSQVVATIGESVITVGDVHAYIERQPREMQARYASHEQRKKLLQHLIEMELLAREGRARGLESHPVVRQTFKQTLAKELLVSLDAKSEGVGAISDDEVSAYYQAHQERFVRPARRRAASIMVRTEAEATDKRAEMMGVIAQNPTLARQVFGDFAAKHSIDGETKELRGDVGWFFADGKNEAGQVRIDQAAATAAFALPSVNSVSKPVALSNETFVLLQLTNEHPREVRALDKVAMDIRSRLLRDEQSARRRTFIDGLKSKAKIEIFETALAPLEGVDKGEGAIPKLRLPNPEELRALSLGKGSAPKVSTTQPEKKGAAAVPKDPKLRLHPSATRQGLLPPLGDRKHLTIQSQASRAEKAKVDEVKERMRKSKAEAAEQ